MHAVRVVFRGDALPAPSVTRRVIQSFVGRIGRLPSTTPLGVNLAALTNHEIVAISVFKPWGRTRWARRSIE